MAGHTISSTRDSFCRIYRRPKQRSEGCMPCFGPVEPWRWWMSISTATFAIRNPPPFSAT